MAATYTDVATLKTYLMKDGRTVDDPILYPLLEAAEDMVRMYTGRDFTNSPVTATRVFSTRGETRVYVPDVTMVTAVGLSGTTLGVDYYDVQYGTDGSPANQIKLHTSVWTSWSNRGLNDVSVTGTWGYRPRAAVVDATYVLAARMFRERGHEYADAIQTEVGVVNYMKMLPARCQAALNAVRRVNVVLV